MCETDIMGRMGTEALNLDVDVLAGLQVPLEFNVPLGPLTWYGVGGHAAVLARPTSVEQLSQLITHCHVRSVPWRILGSGANVLIPEGVVPGVVVILSSDAFKSFTVDLNAATITAGGGADFAKVIHQSVRDGLAGLEGLAGVPATVGGAVRMNAGGAFGEVGPVVERVTVINPDGSLEHLHRGELKFGYRYSNIGQRIIVEVLFKLEASAAPEELRARLKQVMLLKRDSQPMGARSAGCAFKNPKSQTDKAAGWLIDQAGLKGYRVGGAEVSAVHANFVVLHQGGRAADVVVVMEHVESVVKERFGVALEREVVVWSDVRRMDP
jgi:UDP-N-acetylmuramate dehydrogenase